MKHIYISLIAIVALTPQVIFAGEIMIKPGYEKYAEALEKLRIEKEIASKTADKIFKTQQAQRNLMETSKLFDLNKMKMLDEEIARQERILRSNRRWIRWYGEDALSLQKKAIKIEQEALKLASEKAAQKKIVAQAAKLAARQAIIQGARTFLLRFASILGFITAPIEAAGICGEASIQLDKLNGVLFEARQELRMLPDIPENASSREQLRDEISEISGIISDIRGGIRNSWIGRYCRILGIII